MPVFEVSAFNYIITVLQMIQKYQANSGYCHLNYYFHEFRKWVLKTVGKHDENIVKTRCKHALVNVISIVTETKRKS